MKDSSLAWVGELYRAFWKHVGGRPWTFIIRDFAYQNPLLVLLIGINIGFWLAPYLRVIGLSYFAAGLLAGHLFWGTKYIPGESEK